MLIHDIRRTVAEPPARPIVRGRDHETLRLEDASDVRPLQHHRRSRSGWGGGETSMAQLWHNPPFLPTPPLARSPNR